MEIPLFNTLQGMLPTISSLKEGLPTIKTLTTLSLTSKVALGVLTVLVFLVTTRKRIWCPGPLETTIDNVLDSLTNTIGEYTPDSNGIYACYRMWADRTWDKIDRLYDYFCSERTD